jgi:hypothetical protein
MICLYLQVKGIPILVVAEIPVNHLSARTCHISMFISMRMPSQEE